MINILRRAVISNIFGGLFLAILMLAPLVSKAQGKVIIGYCNGEVASSSSIGVNYGNEGIEVASLFPSSLFEKYEDVEALGINVGLTSRLNISEITVWIRESLDGSNIFEASMVKSEGIKTGWNTVSGTQTPLPEDKDLYVGYSLTLSGASYPVSVVGDGCEGGFFRKGTSGWEDMAAKGYGILSVELIATASNLVPYDLALKQVSVPETIKIGSTAPLSLKVQNLGVETVNNFKLVCTCDGYEPIMYDVDQDIESNEYADIILDFTPPMTEKENGVTMNVCIAEIAGGVDADLSNNALKTCFSVNRFDFVKRLLMEEFSTEKCTYCPRAAATLHDLLAEPDFENRILAVVHHTGFGNDWLTIPMSNNYLWFYNGGTDNTYAPAFMYDRFSFDDSSPVSNGTDDYSAIRQRAAERLATAPMTALEATAVYNPETSMIDIHVEGERLPDYQGDRITVCIVENNIKARNQAGTNGDFIHHHAVRDINEIWGEEINWEDDSFSYDTSLYCKPNWIKENLEIIAFISNYDSTNYKNCTVDNAVSAEFIFDGSGMDDIAIGESSMPTEYFTLSGIRIQNPSEGLYIVKRGTKVSKEYLH